MKKIDPIIRFWSHVNKNGPIPEHRKELGQCWLWTASLDGRGYGQIGVDKKMLRAHRFAYTILKGKIPPSKKLDHLCRNRICVNPSHLEPKSNRDNILAEGSLSNPRLNILKTHCPKQHPYSGKNLGVISTSKHRYCKTCNREKVLRYYYERRQK